MRAVWTLLLLQAVVDAVSPGAYFKQRSLLVASEERGFVGGSAQLNGIERLADTVIRNAKAAALLQTPSLASVHFFDAKRGIESNPLFALLQAMPKGAALHVHSDSMVDLNWLIRNATYEPTCHVCGSLNGSDAPNFRFFTPGTKPKGASCTSKAGWQQVTFSEHPPSP